VESPCEYCNEPPNYVNDEKIFERLSASQKRFCSMDLVTEKKPKKLYCSADGGWNEFR
jgi:hypothetical protein